MTITDVEILVIEDDPNDAELITRVLKRNKLADNLLLLTDGTEALDSLFGQGASGSPASTPRVIVLDLKLPKVDGMDILRRLKSDDRTKCIPVVVLTSSTVEQDLQQAYALGANSYVSKPIKFEEFSEVVAELSYYWLRLNKLPAS